VNNCLTGSTRSERPEAWKELGRESPTKVVKKKKLARRKRSGRTDSAADVVAHVCDLSAQSCPSILTASEREFEGHRYILPLHRTFILPIRGKSGAVHVIEKLEGHHQAGRQFVLASSS
jgi:hypothetical protein